VECFIKLIIDNDYRTGSIVEQWITVDLKNGKQLEIFDDYPLIDISEYVNKKVKILVSAAIYDLKDYDEMSESDELTHKIIKGKYLGTIEIPLIWKEKGHWNDESTFDFYAKRGRAIEIEEGIFYLGGYNLERFDELAIGTEIVAKLGRCDILAWYPIEE